VEEALSSLFDQKISFESPVFLPPNHLVLRNFSVAENTPEGGVCKPIFADKIRCVFSIGELLVDRDFVVTEIYLSRPKVSAVAYPLISKEVIAKFIETLKSSAMEQSLKMDIKEAQLVLTEQDESSKSVALDARITIDHAGALRSFGSVGLVGYSNHDVKNNEPKLEVLFLRYNLNAVLADGRLAIDNLELEKGGFSSRLWGSLENNVLRLNGFSSLQSLAGQPKAPGISAGIADRLKKFLRYSHGPGSSSVDLSTYGLNVYDFDCVIEFSLEAVRIYKLGFSVNNIPYLMKGSLSFLDKPSLNLTLSSFPEQSPRARKKNSDVIDARFASELDKGRFKGIFNLDFTRKTKNKEFPDKVEAGFGGLTFHYSDDDRIKALLDEGSFSYTTEENTYKVDLEDLTALFNLEDKRFKFVTFNSKIYDGLMEGEAVVDISQIPPRNSVHLSVREVSATRLSAVLDYFSKVYGRFSGEVDYTGYPYSRLKGKLFIEEGLLDNLVFFSWLADFFGMESFRKIDFDKISAYFEINNKFSSLERIRLDSPLGITLDGYFTLYHDDLVSSRLSLSLPYELLGDSARFKSLLQYLDKDIPYLSFNFQLSGLIESMNFKWLESDFKRGLKKLLPSWIERGIEKKIEDIIESLPDKQGSGR